MDALRPRRHRFARLVVGSVAAALPAAGCGADDGTSADEPLRAYTVALSAVERGDTYSYVSEEQVDLRVGDEVTFEMDNAGRLVHDLVVIAPDGDAIAAADPVAAGQTATLVVHFEEPGRYRLRCNVDDHLTVHDMQVFVDVSNADGTPAA